MVRIFNVSRSGYYDWCSRKPSKREEENLELDTLILKIAKEGRYNYGATKICRQLREQGRFHGEKRIRKRMKLNFILVKRVRKFKHQKSTPNSEVASPNLLKREFNVDTPNKVWVGDITYIKTLKGWVYLAVVLDLFSRKIVGWAVDDNMEAELVTKALHQAFFRRKPRGKVMFHSDQGAQYSSDMFRAALSDMKMVQSMSRRGNCWDNAVVESFNGILKLEWLYTLKSMPKDLEEVKDCLFDYIEIFYNRIRIHSSINYLSPDKFENEFNEQRVL